jgi:hypothetical protein
MKKLVFAFSSPVGVVQSGDKQLRENLLPFSLISQKWIKINKGATLPHIE